MNIFFSGIGFVLVVSADDAQRAISMLETANEKPVVIGKLVERSTGNRFYDVYL